MASPYFGITTEVDCTKAYDNAKENGNSFFAHYLHKSMIAVNSVEELRLRIVDDQVALFEKINAGATVGREDGTFGFIFVNFSDDFKIFNTELQSEIQAVLNSRGLRLNDDDIKKDLIRHSTIPWTSFTGLLHSICFLLQYGFPADELILLALAYQVIFYSFRFCTETFLPLELLRFLALVSVLKLVCFLLQPLVWFLVLLWQQCSF